MTITVVFDPPLPSDSPATFNTKAFTLLGDLNDWSTEANALAVSVNADEAVLDAAVASATASASTATTQAGTATTQAGIATTQAGNAATSAGTATTQAGIATTKAGEANTSAIAAAASADAVSSAIVTERTATATLTNKTLTSPDINGGTIDGTVIGGSSAAAGSFTTLSASGASTLALPITLTGSSADPSGAVRWIGCGSSANYLFYNAITGGDHRFAVNGVTYAIASSTGLSVTGAGAFTGDVGVGTATPDVFSRSDARTLGITSTGATSIGVNAATGSVASVYVGVNGTRSGQVVGDATSLSVIAGSGKVLKLGANFVEHATLDASGNLGLGAPPSPWDTYKVLQIGSLGSVAFDGGSTMESFSNVYYATSNYRYISSSGSAKPSRFAHGNGAFYWFTAPSGTAGNAISFTQAMTLDASGNLLVGTAAAYGVGFTLKPSGEFSSVIAAGSGTHELFINSNGTVGSITTDASVTYFNTSSDARLKENITDSSDAASLIDALQVRQFDWKSDGSRQRYGFVAQELYEVAPEAVSKPQDPDEMMAVDYSKLVPMLVKEIQSLRQRLATAGI